jgi:hypothetical protein
MVTFGRNRGPGRAPKRSQTSISFSTAELEEIGQLLAVGQSALNRRAAAAPRLKAALTRLGVKTPSGL